MSGRVVYTQAVVGNPKQLVLSVDAMAEGMYFLELHTEEGVSRLQLQVIR
jgi:hypothetical protein